MSYSTPVTDTASYKDLDLKLQTLSASIKSKLSWLLYAHGLSDRMVELKDGKPYIYPAVWQGTNAKEHISVMPSDLYDASCFWVKGESELPEYNFARVNVKIACIFFVDLEQILQSTNYKLTKTNIRQDILEAFRQCQFSGVGVLRHSGIIEDDITKVYEGFSLDQVDNKYKIYPKYALRFNFDFGYLLTCNSTFNTYA